MWTSSDVVWRARIQLPIALSHSLSQRYRKRTRRKSVITARPFHSWIGKRDHKFPIPPLFRDEKTKTVKICASDSLSSNFFLNDSENSSFVEEPWLLHPSVTTKSDYDVNKKLNDALLTDYYPAEEPWIFESFIVASTADGTASNVFTNESGNEDEAIVMRNEDSVSTVILINSSICTVQRIAVLENDKLVELLLEPVKTNVQCDSVYLGVVTKLVPHMGGAFVNIGSPRPSFMDIRPNKEPFILPFFHSLVKAREVQVDIHDQNGVEEPDEGEHEQSEDELEGHESHFHFDVLDVIKANVNGGVVRNESEVGTKRSLEQLNGDVGLDAIIKVNGTGVNKWSQVKKGSKIIVQVVKEGLGTKGPTLTANPKLRSRFWVLITRCNTIGISKKISGVERTRLRVIAKTLQPPGFGLTVRTVASGHSLEELQKDLEGLLSTWKSIVDHAKSAALAADEGVDGAVPVMLHRAMGQTLSVVQDYFNEKVKSMVVDSPRTYHEVTNYLHDIAPNLCDRIELYSKRTPIFDEYNIEEEINNILSKRVWAALSRGARLRRLTPHVKLASRHMVPLDNGGYLVIEQTEALVSIDVNGGHCMLGQGTSQEKAILEIARELRLRDIGGIIVVDFIDMLDDANKRLVYEEIKKAVERDRSIVKVSELSRHGLMEITRKRVRPSVTFMISEPCTCCHATGRVEALETSFSKIEHEICRLLSTMDQKADAENPKTWPRFIIRVDRHMCNYLTSGKRTRLAVLSSSLKVWILLKVARGLSRGTFELKLLTDESEDKNGHQGPVISVLGPKEVITHSPTRKLTLFPIKKWKSGGKS
ncbi:ribonuclease e/g-like protein chloroplastic [Phtheirospermum japonicum]|uniref:Ribonuclease e/g-like protein chloroplastic n=1 Tax=Phtheirospermum japonicum TaxID=374723 RepID=A0A830DKH8_9LAMI|nr:ribonuclease e/g-like protein chloroplastic [Phtheirospermum japonicum]